MFNLFLHKMTVFRKKKVTVDGETSTQWVETYTDASCHLSQKILRAGIDTPNTGGMQEFRLFFGLDLEVLAGDKAIINVGGSLYTFITQKPFGYKILKKQEVVLQAWQE